MPDIHDPDYVYGLLVELHEELVKLDEKILPYITPVEPTAVESNSNPTSEISQRVPKLRQTISLLQEIYGWFD